MVEQICCKILKVQMRLWKFINSIKNCCRCNHFLHSDINLFLCNLNFTYKAARCIIRNAFALPYLRFLQLVIQPWTCRISRGNGESNAVHQYLGNLVLMLRPIVFCALIEQFFSEKKNVNQGVVFLELKYESLLQK